MNRFPRDGAGPAADRQRRARAWASWSSTAYVIGHLFDLATTFLLAPTLGGETNVMVGRFGFGWGYLLLSALVSSALMALAQRWLWTTIASRLPASHMGYRDLYHRLLFGAPIDEGRAQHQQLVGLLIACTCVVSYSLVASKWLTVAWHLALLGGFVIQPFALFLWARSLSAAAFGLGFFMIAPYRFQRRLA